MDENNREVTGWTGWVVFASLFLMFDGILQFFYGLGAALNQAWYVTSNSNTAVVFSTKTWGWALMLFGILLFISGALLLSGSGLGRTLAMIFVVLGFLANLALIPVTPVWSIIALVLYAVIGYAIIAHGAEMKRLTQ